MEYDVGNSPDLWKVMGHMWTRGTCCQSQLTWVSHDLWLTYNQNCLCRNLFPRRLVLHFSPFSARFSSIIRWSYVGRTKQHQCNDGSLDCWGEKCNAPSLAASNIMFLVAECICRIHHRLSTTMNGSQLQWRGGQRWVRNVHAAERCTNQFTKVIRHQQAPQWIVAVVVAVWDKKDVGEVISMGGGDLCVEREEGSAKWRLHHGDIIVFCLALP